MSRNRYTWPKAVASTVYNLKGCPMQSRESIVKEMPVTTKNSYVQKIFFKSSIFSKIFLMYIFYFFFIFFWN